MSSSKNLEFEKTSFLNKANSAFIEQMYLKYINKDVIIKKFRFRKKLIFT